MPTLAKYWGKWLQTNGELRNALLAILLLAGFQGAALATPDLGSAIWGADPNPVTAGADIQVTVNVQNVGTSPAGNSVLAIAFPGARAKLGSLPPNCSATSTGAACNLPALQPGEFTQRTVLFTAPAVSGVVQLTSRVILTADQNPANDTYTVPITVSSTGESDLGITAEGPDETILPEGAFFFFHAKNHGPDPLPGGARIDIDLPPDSTLVGREGICTHVLNTLECELFNELDVGETKRIRVIMNPPAPGPFSLGARIISSPADDPNEENNSVSISSTALEQAEADLFIQKSAPATALAGSSFNYSLVVHNNGPDAGEDVRVTDELPAGVIVHFVPLGCSVTGQTVTCDLGTFAAYSTRSLILSVSMPDSPGTVTNRATITDLGSTVDPHPDNNSSSATTTVTAADPVDPDPIDPDPVDPVPVGPPGTDADLSIMKLGPASVSAASEFGYTLLVTNHGPAAATGVAVTDTLPDGLALQDAPADCTFSAPDLVCAPAALAAGESVQLMLRVIAPDVAAELLNTAHVAATQADPDLSNNESSVATSVVTLPPEPEATTLTLAPTPGSPTGLRTRTGAAGITALGFTVTAGGDGIATLTGLELEALGNDAHTAVLNVRLYAADDTADDAVSGEPLAAGHFDAEGSLVLEPARQHAHSHIEAGTSREFVVVIDLGVAAARSTPLAVLALAALALTPFAMRRRRVMVALLVGVGLVILAACQTTGPDRNPPDGQPQAAEYRLVLTGVTASGTIGADEIIAAGVPVHGPTLTVDPD